MDSHHNLLSSADKESDDSSDYSPGKEYYRETGNIKQQRSLRRLLFVALFVQLIFLFYGTFLFIKSFPPARVYPDIYDGLNLREHAQKMTRSSQYDGRPTAETSQAWHDLLDVGIISITEQEKNRLPFDTARNVFVENEYVVELNIFHQLHCLHSLREQLYNPRIINYDEPVHFWEWHMNHCVESLRNSLMCHADITPQRFVWDEESIAYSLDTGHGQFQCRNWDDIWNFAKARNTTGDGALNFKAFGKDGKEGMDAELKWEKINAEGGISVT